MKTKLAKIVKGQTLNTPFGDGVVIGFERWDENENMYLEDTQEGTERIYLDLKEGHSWPYKSKPFAYFYHEVRKYNPDLPIEEVTDES
jgi:hypothetical protein